MKTLLLIPLACMLTLACQAQNKQPIKIEPFKVTDTTSSPSTDDLDELKTPSKHQSSHPEEIDIWLDKPFLIVEEMPMFPNGDTEMYKFINKNFSYPEMSQEQKSKGRLVLRFIVDKNGDLRDIRTVRNEISTISDSLISVVKRMPRWIPGKQNGKNVSVYYTIVINYNPKYKSE